MQFYITPGRAIRFTSQIHIAMRQEPQSNADLLVPAPIPDAEFRVPGYFGSRMELPLTFEE